MNQGKIIEKIFKCLKLSESSNPNEAALALRQAHNLMQKYNISEHRVRSACVAERAVASGFNSNPPFWALALVNLVADVFDCRGFIDRYMGDRSQFRFIGIEDTAEVATYSFSVLLRQLSAARDEFIDSIDDQEDLEIQRRADIFAQAWLFRVENTIKDFVGNIPARESVDKYVHKKYGQTAEFAAEPADTQEEDLEPILSGMRAANDVSLFRPVSSTMQTVRLEELHS